MKKVKSKKYRMGVWSEGYIQELLRGGHIHNPLFYLEGKAKERTRWSKTEGDVRFRAAVGGYGFYVKYCASWNSTWDLFNETNDIISISHPNKGKGDYIYVLKKYFKRFLKYRLTDQYGQYKLYTVEDRRLLFQEGVDGFKVYSYKYRTIRDILAEQVIEELDKNNQSNLTQ